jgi:hypothetical protein
MVRVHSPQLINRSTVSRRKWSEEDLKFAVKESKNYSEVLRFLGLKSLSNQNIIKEFINKLKIDISHFESKHDLYIRTLLKKGFKKTPLSKILIENSHFNRSHLKERLYKEGLKKRICELCGQDENWKGKKISLILDHINGINNDNRLKNLQIVCPNCAATLETHCGKNLRGICEICGESAKYGKLYCSSKCYHKAQKSMLKTDQTIQSDIQQRKSKRPLYSQLKEDIQKLGFSGTGKKYNVSDNGIRKWLRFYEKYGV